MSVNFYVFGLNKLIMKFYYARIMCDYKDLFSVLYTTASQVASQKWWRDE